jgi:hypothetical protein
MITAKKKQLGGFVQRYRANLPEIISELQFSFGPERMREMVRPK